MKKDEVIDVEKKVDVPKRIIELEAEVKECQEKIAQYNQAVQQLTAQAIAKTGALEELKKLI